MVRGMVSAAITALAVSALVSCSEEPEVDPADVSPSVLFRQAEALMASSPTQAAAAFEEIEQYHPYAPEAKWSILRASEAYFEAGRFDEALAAAERFLNFYPGDKEASRAQYIRALSEYDQISDPMRSQSRSRAAQRELQGLLQRFPESEIAADARLRLDAVRSQLAAHELEVGRFYLRNGRNAAAIGRFRTVVDQYPTTEAVAEALYRLVEANLAIGLRAEARRAGVVLGYNFPASDWYRDAYELLGDPDG